LLDLLQQNIKLLYREERLKILVDIALHVAKNSPRSFLRCKAFEVLISVGKMEGVGIHKVEREVEQTLRAETSRWTGSLRKIPDQWRGMKTKAGEMDMFRAQISSITVDSPSLSLEVSHIDSKLIRRRQRLNVLPGRLTRLPECSIHW
jgi:hypothetical protein